MWASGVLKKKAKGKRETLFFFPGGPEDVGQCEKKKRKLEGSQEVGGRGLIMQGGKKKKSGGGSSAARRSSYGALSLGTGILGISASTCAFEEEREGKRVR